MRNEESLAMSGRCHPLQTRQHIVPLRRIIALMMEQQRVMLDKPGRKTRDQLAPSLHPQRTTQGCQSTACSRRNHRHSAAFSILSPTIRSSVTTPGVREDIGGLQRFRICRATITAIANEKAHEFLDIRGNTKRKVDVRFDSEALGRAAVPLEASTLTTHWISGSS